jgi:hypothetical protein
MCAYEVRKLKEAKQGAVIDLAYMLVQNYAIWRLVAENACFNTNTHDTMIFNDLQEM